MSKKYSYATKYNPYLFFTKIKDLLKNSGPTLLFLITEAPALGF